MTAKEYLLQVWELDQEVKLIQEKIDKLHDALDIKGVSYDGVNVKDGGCSDRMAEVTAKVADYAAEKQRKVVEFIDKYMEIERTIHTLGNATERFVLERRYLLFQPWDSRFDKESGEYVKGISDSMGYSRSRIFEIHGEALKKINIGLNRTASD